MLNLFKKKDEDFMSYNVLTSKGIIPVEKVKIGDILYKYPTGEFMIVKNIKKSDMGIVHCMIYDDGRTQNVIGGIKDISEVSRGDLAMSSLHHIYQLIDFQCDNMTSLYPDPYSAGILLTQGDWSDPYINLPKFVGDDIDLLPDMKGSTRLFPTRFDSLIDYLYDDKGHKIKWKTLFPKDDFYKKKNVKGKRLFPNRYKMASVEDRKEFIRGALTGGMLWNLSDMQISIANKNSDILKELKNVLLSLGIISTIDYRASDDRFFGYPYRLTILPGENDKYSEILYDMKKICDAGCLHTDPLYESGKVRINSIKVTTKKSYTLDIEFYDSKQLFYADDFLPRMSL